MYFRKLISALVFVVFGFCFSDAARAQSCNIFAPDFDPFFCDPFDPSCACNSWYYFCPNCTMDSTTGSTLQCAILSGGSNVVNKDAKTFAQIAEAACTHTDSTGPHNLGICDFKLLMTGVTLSSGCGIGDCHIEGFCTNSNLDVTGSISNCSLSPSSVMNLGIAGIQRNKNKCELAFPDGILPKNKILDVTFRTNPDGSYFQIGETKTRSCNSPNLNNSAVQCIAANTGVVHRTNEAADSAVPFEFNVRQTINTTTCKTGDTDKGNANIDIFGSNTIHVVDIDVSSLRCGGADPLKREDLQCDPPKDLNRDGFPDLTCKVDTCPNFGPELGKLTPNPDGTVTATCTGSLKPPSNQAILGFDEVAVSP
jgi:hypothetical protein